jgi:hypothetical protein
MIRRIFHHCANAMTFAVPRTLTSCIRSGGAGGITAAAWTTVSTPSPYGRKESRRVTSPRTTSAVNRCPGRRVVGEDEAAHARAGGGEIGAHAQADVPGGDPSGESRAAEYTSRPRMSSPSTADTRERTARRALVASVFLVSAVLRLAAVDRPLNIDEALWIRRGGAFVAALARGDLSATYARPHPGVTTMWLVGHADVAWCALAQDGSWTSCARRLADDPLPPLWAYTVPRAMLAFFTAALLALMAFLAVPFLG